MGLSAFHYREPVHWHDAVRGDCETRKHRFYSHYWLVWWRWLLKLRLPYNEQRQSIPLPLCLSQGRVRVFCDRQHALVIEISLTQLPITLTILSQTRWSALRDSTSLTSPGVTARLYSDLPDCVVLCNKSIAYQHQSAVRVSKSKIKVHHCCCCRESSRERWVCIGVTCNCKKDVLKDPLPA